MVPGSSAALPKNGSIECIGMVGGLRLDSGQWTSRTTNGSPSIACGAAALVVAEKSTRSRRGVEAVGLRGRVVCISACHESTT